MRERKKLGDMSLNMVFRQRTNLIQDYERGNHGYQNYE